LKNEITPRIAVHIKASKWAGARVAALLTKHFGSIKSIEWVAAFDQVSEESRPTLALRCDRSWPATTAATAFWAELREAQKSEQLYICATILADATPMYADAVAD